jgi:hypothetical protein
MRSKFRFVLLSVCLLIIAGIISLPEKSSAASNKDIKIITYFQKGNKTYSYDLASKSASEVAPIAGVVSNDGNKIAYVEYEPQSLINKPFIFIKDLASGTTESIPVDIDYTFDIHSWSPDDKYILVEKGAQFVGGQQGYIYEYATHKHIATLNLLSNHIVWADDGTLFYFDPLVNCQLKDVSKCDNTITLTQYNIASVTYTKLYQFKANELTYPQISGLEVDANKARIAYEVFNAKNNILDFSKSKKYQYEIDIKSKVVKETELLGNKILRSLPEFTNEYEVKNLKKMGNSYILEIASIKEENREYLVNFEGSSGKTDLIKVKNTK